MNLFDFNLYTGDIYGNTNSSFIQFLETIFATAFGVAIAKGWDLLSDRRRIIRSGEDLINEIFLLEEPINKQIISNNTLISLLKEEKSNDPLLNISFSLDTSRIEYINRVDALKYFENKYKNRKLAREKVNHIYVSLDIIYYNHTSIKEYFNNFIDRSNIELGRCAENANRISQKAADIQTGLKKSPSPKEDKFANELIKLVTENLDPNKKNIDLMLLRNTFFEPLSVLLNANRADERTSSFFELSYQCRQSLKELVSLKKELIFKFEMINKSLLEQMTNLKSDVEEFDSH